MSLDTVRGMLPDLAALKTRSVLISGGEPLLNAEWKAIADLLLKHEMRLWLLTSGLSLAKNAAAVAERFESVTVSLDGTTRETYKAIRGVDAFSKVCAGIKAIASAGIRTGVRVTLQKQNFRELPRFVTLASELGADHVSFLAVDVSNAHAFSRAPGHDLTLTPGPDELKELDALIEHLKAHHQNDFSSRFIAESPEKLQRIRSYFSAVNGLCDFPDVRCNAPEFSAVIGADGRISPCFFIAGPSAVPRAPELRAGLRAEPMQTLQRAIRSKKRHECATCVCSMWREPEHFSDLNFSAEKSADAQTR